MTCRAVALVTVALGLGLAGEARAQEHGETASSRTTHRLSWNEEWPRFRVIEYGITATLGVELALIHFAWESPRRPRYSGGVLFDDSVRSALRLESRSARETAGLVSDITAVVPLYAQAVVVDALVVPLLLDHGNGDVALQLEMMNFLSMGAVGTLSRLGHKTIARARPNAEECRDAPASDTYCADPYDGLPAGHAAGAFIGAGLSCAHHSYLPLYGHRAVDMIVGCAAPVTLAATTGVLRIAADQHYTTDVLIGSTIGFLGGFGLPMALHYGLGRPSRDVTAPRSALAAGPLVAPVVGPGVTGVSVFGRF